MSQAPDQRDTAENGAESAPGAGSSPDQQQLVEDCQGLVHSLARKVHRQLPERIELDDLIAYGQVGVSQAARDFDPSRGGQFSTFAYYRIRGAIYDGLSKLGWHSRAQYRKIRYEQLANEVVQDSHDETPAGDLNEEAQWLSKLTSSLAVIYLATQAGDSEQGFELEDQRVKTPLSEAAGREASEKLHELINQLPDDQRKLIRDVYFEGLTIQEAGKRQQISKSWASRLHAKTLQNLFAGLSVLGLG